jgi:hypothetical protein
MKQIFKRLYVLVTRRRRPSVARTKQLIVENAGS